MNAHERETTITASDGDGVVRIWTAQRRYLGRLRRHPDVTLVAQGTWGGSVWAEFTVPAERWNPLTGLKRRAAAAQYGHEPEQLRRARTRRDAPSGDTATPRHVGIDVAVTQR